MEAKWFGSFWKHLWENSVFDSSIKKSLRIFVIAPELGSASPIMTHVFESAACCEYAYLEFCLPLLRDRSSVVAPLMERPALYYLQAIWTAKCTILFIVPVARFLALLLC